MRRSVVAVLLVLGFGSTSPVQQVPSGHIRQQVVSYLSDTNDVLEHWDKGLDRYLEVFNLRNASRR